ncbi:hypothetical protein HOY34_02020 [Xinfangfangia sp. D13-10-4-6]|uniref:hypothetical protein n=1 Tax=Pseudogemmobacter hezensis TaxID=2737662 RepID=UPI0015565747|nr:hypothetical protein [Pseudogemmobacter hezensis]NPD13975.1 hypothetical protein [Pseudogemmobacter hezensis]
MIRKNIGIRHDGGECVGVPSHFLTFLSDDSQSKRALSQMLISIRTSSVPLEAGQDMRRMISVLVMSGIIDGGPGNRQSKKCACGKIVRPYFDSHPQLIPSRVSDWTFW